MDPKGKCAVVTGAASGLGLAITRELLTNGLQVSTDMYIKYLQVLVTHIS